MDKQKLDNPHFCLLEELYHDVFDIILNFISTEVEILFQQMLKLSLLSKKMRSMIFENHTFSAQTIFEQYFWPQYSLQNDCFALYEPVSVYKSLGKGLKTIYLFKTSNKIKSQVGEEYLKIIKMDRKTLENDYRLNVKKYYDTLLELKDDQKLLNKIRSQQIVLQTYPIVYLLDRKLYLENQELILDKPKKVYYWGQYSKHNQMPFETTNLKMIRPMGLIGRTNDGVHKGSTHIYIGFKNDKLYAYDHPTKTLITCNQILNIKSFSSADKEYVISEGKCSCADFKYHGPRKCKHIEEVINNCSTYNLVPEFRNYLLKLYS